MRIYVASSWRNKTQPGVVASLRLDGHEVYDFRNPRPGEHGFHWSEIDPDYGYWTAAQFRDSLRSPIARAGFASDFDAMRWAEAVVLILPCGRSVHLELGWAVGAGKRTALLLDHENEPELMYSMVDHLSTTLANLLAWAAGR